jgi:hypothetical protein
LARPRKPWSRPKQITPETVARELAHPAERREGEGIVRREQTVGRYWRHGRTFLASLGLSVKLPKKRGRRGTSRDYAPRMTLPPPLVPRRAEVVGWWRQTLDPHSGQLKTRQALRRRVVLMQGLDLLTGCRIGELLQAETQYLEGHWLLLHPEAVKTRWPRMLYLTCQALAIAQELRRWTPTGQKEMFDVRGQGQRFAGWTQSVSWWHKQVKRCLPQPNLPKGEADKRHQGLRRICSTWLHRRDPIAEAAQLGHGRGDVVSAHYLDVLRRLPRCMDRKPMRLPELEGFTWPTPIEAEQHVPKRLYAEFKRMVQE